MIAICFVVVLGSAAGARLPPKEVPSILDYDNGMEYRVSFSAVDRGASRDQLSITDQKRVAKSRTSHKLKIKTIHY
eukprot:2759747-Amphidinium_carterae.1